MREIRSPGSVRGAARKGRPYRDRVLKLGKSPHPCGHGDDDARCQSRRAEPQRQPLKNPAERYEMTAAVVPCLVHSPGGGGV